MAFTQRIQAGNILLIFPASSSVFLINVFRLLCHFPGYNGKDIILHAVCIQEFRRFQYHIIGSAAILTVTVRIMDFPRSINRQAYQKMFLRKEPAPFSVQKPSIGLKPIMYLDPSAVVLSLKFCRLFEKIQSS